MIIDTDTHAIPMEVFGTDFEPKNLVDRIRGTLSTHFDINRHWKEIYSAVKAPNWPSCDTVADFAKLPEEIRHELKHEHSLTDLVHITDDLESLHVDHYYNGSPDIETSIRSAKLFCKVDKQIVNPPATLFKMTISTDRALAVKLMHTWNTSMTELCKQKPELDFTLWLAMQDFDASMQELEKYADSDFFGVWLDERQPWAWQQDKMSFFEFCNDRKIPVYFHLVGIEDAPVDWQWDYSNLRYRIQLKQWPNADFITSGERWQANIASFITEGILDRFPDLRIVVTEHGLEWIRPMQEFMVSRGWPDPVPYFKRNFWFTTEPEEQNFLSNAELLGWDRLLFATDYPHNDIGGAHRFKDVDLLQNWLANGTISQTQYDQITHKNYQLLKSRQ